MTSTLSLNDAARRAGLSRWPVSRALQAGHLRGIRDNRGRWRIEADHLDAWAAEHGPAEPSTGALSMRHEPPHGADKASTVPARSPAPRIEAAELRLRLEAAELRAAELTRERDEARGERDRWRAMAERLVEREAERPVVLQPRRGLLAHLFGWGSPKPRPQPTSPREPQAVPVDPAMAWWDERAAYAPFQAEQDAPRIPEAPKEEPALLQVSERRRAVLSHQAEERAESERTGQPLLDRTIRPSADILEAVERRRTKRAAQPKPF